MSVTSGEVVEIDGENAAPPGYDRRRTLILAFAMCLAVGSAFVGRDGPAQVAPVETSATLSLPPGMSDVVLFGFPDRLANEALPPFAYRGVAVRSTEGLAIDRLRPGDLTVVTWTENGTMYVLSSPRRDLRELIDLAGKLH